MSEPDGGARSRLRHDLRTALHQIIGYAELIEEEIRERGGASHAADLARIQLAARNAVRAMDSVGPEDQARSGESTTGRPSTPVADGGAAVRTHDRLPVVAGTPARVLVVDDDEGCRDLLSRRLRARGLSVETADDGETALASLARQVFDLVLLDIVMPRLNGLEVLDRIRRRWPETDLPVIMTTGCDATEDMVAALRGGANDYVTKPLDLPVVLARLQTQLALRRQKQEIRTLADDLERTSSVVRGLFGRYLSDDVVSGLLASPEGTRLGGEHRRVTLLLSDLRGFTPLTEDLPPQQVLRLLNSYLGSMADVILSHQGMVDEFVGDAILAIFGAPLGRPDDAHRALACAVDMQAAMAELNRRNQAEGLPPLEMGIAVNTGDVIVGNIGSERRTKYGVVGSAVNRAGRIESFTVGGQVLVSEATLEAAGDGVRFGRRLLIDAKGTREPIVVYELRGVDQALVPDAVDERVLLRSAVDVVCHLVDGKAVQAEAFAARIIELSKRGATLSSSRRLRVLSNIKLELPVPDGDAPAIYGKVVGVSPEGSLDVRFASLPTAASNWLKNVLERPPAAADP